MLRKILNYMAMNEAASNKIYHKGDKKYDFHPFHKRISGSYQIFMVIRCIHGKFIAPMRSKS